jgi:hypothetical protein
VPARVSLAYDWRLLLAIEPLCLLRKHGPIPSHLLIRNLYEGISCLLRKLSRAIRFAPILICSKPHRPLTRARGVRSANRSFGEIIRRSNSTGLAAEQPDPEGWAAAADG